MWKWSAADYNGVLKLVEQWLKRVLASTSFDVETVELKGRCPSVVWGKDYDRQVKHFTMGGLAKMPRDATRLAEWQATTHMTAHDLRKLPELYPVEATVEVKKSVKKQAAAASVQGNLIDKERFPEVSATGAKVRACAGTGQRQVEGLGHCRGCGDFPRPAGVLRRESQRGWEHAVQKVRRNVEEALPGWRRESVLR